MRTDYNLNLLFSAKGSGEYLSDVRVRIDDASGYTFLDAVSGGPMFFAKLKPGRYRISAFSKGGFE